MCDVYVQLLSKHEAGDNVAAELAQHSTSICFDCGLAEFRDRRGDVEMLFVAGPPPWHEPAPPAASKQPAAKKQQSNSRKIPDGMTLDEYIEGIVRKGGMPRGLLINEYRNRAQCSKEDAILNVKQILIKVGQEKQAAAAQTKNKLGLAKSEMAWAPSLKLVFCRFARSMMLAAQQKRYVAILTNLVSCDHALKHEDNYEELKAWDIRLQRERIDFQSEVVQFLSKFKGAFDWTLYPACKYPFDRWKKRYELFLAHNEEFANFSPDALIEIKTSTYSTAIPTTASRIKIHAVPITISDPPALVVPSVKLRATSELDRNLMLERYPLSNMEANFLMNDEKAVDLCVAHGVSVIMEASAALVLCIDDVIGVHHSFAIPIKIEERFLPSGMQRICIIDKPLPFGKITKPTLMRTYVKWLVRSKVERQKTAAAGKRTARNKKSRDKPSSTTGEKSQPQDSEEAMDSDTSGAGDLQIAEGKEPPEPEPLPSTSATTPSAGTSSNAERSFLDNLLDVAAQTSKAPAHASTSQFALVSFADNARPVLIKSRGGALNRDLNKRFSTAVKLEYLPQCGAMKLSDEEWLRNSLKTQLMGNDRHLLFRAHSRHELLLQVEHVNENVRNYFMGENTESRSLLKNRRCARLQEVLNNLGILEPGCYMLKKTPETMTFHRCVKGHDNTMVKLHRTLHYDSAMSYVPTAFSGIDMHRFLQWQVVMGRAPATFLPPDHPSIEALKHARTSQKPKFQKKQQKPGYQFAKKARNNDDDDVSD